MSSSPVTQGSVYLVAHTALRINLFVGAAGAIIVLGWWEIAFDELDRHGPFHWETFLSFVMAASWFAIAGFYLVRGVSEPVFAITPVGFVIPSRNLCIPWTQIDRVSLRKNSFQIYTVASFLPEKDMEKWSSRIPFRDRAVKLARGDNEFQPLVKLTGLNQRRDRIVKALTHYLGEDRIT